MATGTKPRDASGALAPCLAPRPASLQLSPKTFLGLLFLATSQGGLETLAGEATELLPPPWVSPAASWVLTF